MLIRGVSFPLAKELPSEARFLLADFRMTVNEAIRAGISAHLSSRNAIAKLAYRRLREDHPKMYSLHVVSAIEVGSTILKSWRRRHREGKQVRVPFAKRLMMKAENQAFRLDREKGIVDLPIRAGYRVKLELVVSRYHRRYLDDPTLTLGTLTVLPDRVIVAFRKEAPRQCMASSVVSLDTNESSMDGSSSPHASRHCHGQLKSEPRSQMQH